MEFYYDAVDAAYKSRVGALEEGEELNINVKTKGVSDCGLVLRYDGEDDCVYPMVKNAVGFSITLKKLKRGLIWYYFNADGEKVGNDGCCFAVIGTDNPFQLSVCAKRAKLTNYDDVIMYQIMPDRFAKADGYGCTHGRKMREWGDEPEYLPNANGKILNNDFFGGNLEGIRSKLPYLRDLGVNRIYLNPIFKAESNHRYDTGDYMTVDPLLGTLSDLENLILSAKKYDVCIILDGVFNHTGDNSIYFNKYGQYDTVGAYQSKNSEYYGWYIFDEFPNKYKSWWGIDILPTVDKNCVEFENFITGDGGVLDKYLSLGIGGVRLDVVDEIPDEFVKKIYNRVKRFGEDKAVIGEVWEDATNKIAYGVRRTYFTEPELDGVMNYPLKNAIIDFVISGRGEVLYSVIRNQLNNYPHYSLQSLMNILGTHDTPRILTVLGKSGKLADNRRDMAVEKLTEKEILLGIQRLKCASFLQFTLYGFPCIYYGDEIGMQGNRDPFNRRCFEFEKRIDEVYEWYKRLTYIKRKYPCFKGGEVLNPAYKDGVLTFERRSERGVALIAVNCSDSVCDIKLKTEQKEITRNIKTDKIALNTYDYAIFYNGDN